MAYRADPGSANSETVRVKRGRRAVRSWMWVTSAAAVLASLAVAAAVSAWPSAPAAPPPVEVIRQGGNPAEDAASGSPATASSWFMTPIPQPEVPSADLSPAVLGLITRAGSMGVRIVTQGQDWGEDETAQMRNIGAVIAGLERLPDAVRASIVTGAGGGRLSVLSNAAGRTEHGWQPYGGTPRSFYTNSDQGPEGQRAAHQIVLAPGSDTALIVHELLHAYQFRATPPGEYVGALLDDELRSFMAATGWRQTAADGAVLAAMHEQWETVNGLFAYEGRALEYEDENGYSTSMMPPNPLEAFAMAGALYYGRPQGMALPDWPEHWRWFSSHLGEAVGPAAGPHPNPA